MKSDPIKIAAWQERSRQAQRDKPKAGTALRRTANMKPRAVIRKVSARRKAQNQEYAKRRAAFLRENPLCARCASQGRQEWATEIHHKAGREGERLNDEARWVQLCRDCHQWATDNGAAAKAAGWSLSRIGGGEA